MSAVNESKLLSYVQFRLPKEETITGINKSAFSICSFRSMQVSQPQSPLDSPGSREASSKSFLHDIYTIIISSIYLFWLLFPLIHKFREIKTLCSVSQNLGQHLAHNRLTNTGSMRAGTTAYVPDSAASTPKSTWHTAGSQKYSWMNKYDLIPLIGG